LEETLLIIKPDAVAAGFSSSIIQRINEEGFIIKKCKQLKLSKSEAANFYKVHKGKPFYKELVNFISSDKIIALRLMRKDAVSYLRKIVGATDPTEAAPNTIRNQFGSSIRANAVHASDSFETAKEEIAFFFRDE
jgi:nucleoside-diphosphate kinase